MKFNEVKANIASNDTTKKNSQHHYLMALAALAALCLLVIAGIFQATGGHFAYVLDDTYIYLALAENLPHTYSLNAAGQDGGAPASSILYPYLLLPFMHTPLAVLAPLLINLLAAALVLALLFRLERQCAIFPHPASWARALCILGFTLLLNLLLLIFAGMEHTLHLAATLAILSGLLQLADSRQSRLPWWFWLALISAPLLRYEALALSLASLAYLAWCGRGRTAIGALVLMLIGPLAFSFYLHNLGYAWLPSSVLSKSVPLTLAQEGAQGMTLFIAVLFNLFASLMERPTSWVHLLLMAFLTALLLRPLTRAQKGLVLVVLAASAAHLLLGKFGWWGRYHPYILSAQLIVLLAYAKPLWQRFRLSGLTLLLLSGTASLYYTTYIPAAAGQIYKNHGLLQRFIVEYWQGPVAAYDVGYISWQNPHEVFDLFGLASEQVRRLIRTPQAQEVIPQRLAERGIDLVIAQSNFSDHYWLAHWQRFAELQLPGRALVTTVRPQFFLLNPSREAELQTKLVDFAKTLPADVRLQFLPPAAIKTP